MKLYVRPKEAMERVVGGIDQTEQMPSHPSLAFHDLIKKLGNIVPQSPKDVTVMQRRLIRAGIRSDNALKILYGAKAALGVVLPLLTALVDRRLDRPIPGNKFCVDSGGRRGGILRTQRIRAPDGRASASMRSRAGCPTRSTCWWFASRADWVSIRPFCRFRKNWTTRIRRSARSSDW